MSNGDYLENISILHYYVIGFFYSFHVVKEDYFYTVEIAYHITTLYISD